MTNFIPKIRVSSVEGFQDFANRINQHPTSISAGVKATLVAREHVSDSGVSAYYFGMTLTMGERVLYLEPVGGVLTPLQARLTYRTRHGIQSYKVDVRDENIIEHLYETLLETTKGPMDVTECFA